PLLDLARVVVVHERIVANVPTATSPSGVVHERGQVVRAELTRLDSPFVPVPRRAHPFAQAKVDTQLVAHLRGLPRCDEEARRVARHQAEDHEQEDEDNEKRDHRVNRSPNQVRPEPHRSPPRDPARLPPNTATGLTKERGRGIMPPSCGSAGCRRRPLQPRPSRGSAARPARGPEVLPDTPPPLSPPCRPGIGTLTSAARP